MLRGGAWNNNPDNCRAANRNDNAPDNRNNNIGFRVCRGSHIVNVPESGGSPPIHRKCRPTTVCRPRPGSDRWRRHVPSARPSRRRAHSKAGRHLDSLPWRPPYPALFWRIQPPRSLPISATMPLTCAYCPSLIHAQWWASRK
ncbi:MAG: hypothetical protein KA855_14910 [Zoogloea sp.]|nr:hypothetical protein [Zoogloea sp.]